MVIFMEKNKVLEILQGYKYYGLNDLRYNKNIGLLFSNEKLNDFLQTKDCLIDEGCFGFEKIELKTFNSKHLFFFAGNYLQSYSKDYLSTLVKDERENNESLLRRNFKDIMISRVFSEIEGSLNIENVPTTHKRIKQIFETDNLTDKNDVIIKNMLNAMKYIIDEKPIFNKENLFKLYSLLSTGCLNEEDKLKQGQYYRDAEVFVGGYEGVDFKLLDEYMNDLFDFANNDSNVRKYGIYLPHICHYYILYLHPYFDYNGRTARMVSFWISVLNNMINVSPIFMSEAINEYKTNYYEAIKETRNANNDLTYFLGFIFETAIKFSLIYKNIEHIKERLSITGEFLSTSEIVYLKKILVHNHNNYFNCKMFMGYVGNNVSKQYALKILNRFSECGVVDKDYNKNKELIFKMNQDFLIYKLD